MGRGNKLERFAQIKSFSNVFEPDGVEIRTKDYSLKGNWSREYFKNDNPITLELGCGKGEYTVGLAQKYPDRNFIGIDIKGARMWKGARFALENNIHNAAFVRSRIEFIERLFAANEISEIWITFPDPFPKKAANRLSSNFFLNRYKKIMAPGGIVHLKTDCRELHEYTLDVLAESGVSTEEATNDLYSSGKRFDEILGLKTFYEKMFLEVNKPITYLKFNIDSAEVYRESHKPWKLDD